jgi:hypothetical protein
MPLKKAEEIRKFILRGLSNTASSYVVAQTHVSPDTAKLVKLPAHPVKINNQLPLSIRVC